MNKEPKFDLDDILIEPTIISEIDSRKNVKVFDHNGMLPIFTAPMLDVVSSSNWERFKNVGIYSILPRKTRYNKEDLLNTTAIKWQAMGLDDFIEFFIDKAFILPKNKSTEYWILIDIANGHMKKLESTIIKAKEQWGSSLKLMVGNIANPYTYKVLSAAGADYIRLSVGSGSGCLTSVQTAIGYPLASLIYECAKLKREMIKDEAHAAHIIADGGIKNYSDIIKALVLGADFAMMGGTLNRALESASPLFIESKGLVRQLILKDIPELISMKEFKDWLDKPDSSLKLKQLRVLVDNKQSTLFLPNEDFNNIKFLKLYRGMSTKEVQRELGNPKPKTSEGTVKYNEVEYTLKGWVENFIHYLSSAMSYTGYSEISKFRGGPDWNFITGNALKRFSK